MGRHDKHLPRKDLNKTAGHTSKQEASAKAHREVAAAQGQQTKQDAKDAKGQANGK